MGVPEELANIRIEHIDQLGGSDMNLLTRLAERYGALSKVTHDRWVIIPRESVTTVGGKTKILRIGSGEPVVQYSWPQPDLQSAREVAAGFSTASKKRLMGMNVGLVATPELMNLITTQGFGSTEDKDWHISRLNIDLMNQGFLVSLDLE